MKTNKRLYFKKINITLIAICIVWMFSSTTSNVNAQNTSYNANTIPIGGTLSTAFGFQALLNNTGTYNTGIGWKALLTNSTGGYNTAVGGASLQFNTTGVHNSAIGSATLMSNTTGSYNTVSGSNSMNSNTIGSYNTAYGNQALLSNVAGSNATAIGSQAMRYTNDQAGAYTNYNVAVGYQALMGSATPANNTGNYNTAIGYRALPSNTSGAYNTAIGYQALQLNTTGSYNTAHGQNALDRNTTGDGNTANGQNSLLFNTTGSYNTAEGHRALYNNSTGSQNSATGYSSLYTNTTGSNNTAIGYNADVLSNNLTNATAIGYNAKVTNSNAIQLGNNTVTQVFVGTGNSAKLIAGGLQITGGVPSIGKVLTSDGAGNATWQVPNSGGWSLTGNAGTIDNVNFIGTTDNKPLNFRVNNQKAGRIDHALSNAFYGYQSGNVTIGSENTAIGHYTLLVNTTGSQNTANGCRALYLNTTGSANTANGYNALYSNTTGYSNTAIGYLALSDNTTGYSNTANGHRALDSNTTGSENTASGLQSLFSNTTGDYNTANGYRGLELNDTGSENTANGSWALYSNTAGNSNTANGYRALYSNITGNNNTAIGHAADVSVSNLTNATAIGYNAKVTTSNAIQLGNNSVTQVFLGTGNTAKLIAGGLQITGGVPAVGKVLTSDGAGNATWQVVPNGGGGIGGSGTINYVPKFTPDGTTLGNSLIFDDGNKIRIGNVTTPGNYKLYVDDGILTEKVKVAVSGSQHWADFVFANNYELKPLSEVESFIKKNKHLPGVPSAEEVVKEGLDVAQMDAKLLEKIEELTLYMIEMKKEIEDHKRKIDQLEKENASYKTSSIKEKR